MVYILLVSTIMDIKNLYLTKKLESEHYTLSTVPYIDYKVCHIHKDIKKFYEAFYNTWQVCFK